MKKGLWIVYGLFMCFMLFIQALMVNLTFQNGDYIWGILYLLLGLWTTAIVVDIFKSVFRGKDK